MWWTGHCPIILFNFFIPVPLRESSKTGIESWQHWRQPWLQLRKLFPSCLEETVLFQGCSMEGVLGNLPLFSHTVGIRIFSVNFFFFFNWCFKNLFWGRSCHSHLSIRKIPCANCAQVNKTVAKNFVVRHKSGRDNDDWS